MSRLLTFKLGILLLIAKIVLARPSELLGSQEGMNDYDIKQVKFLHRINPAQNSIGQVGGIDTSFDGNLVVFHRGSRKWSYDSFQDDVFNTEKYGPIAEDVLSLIDTQTFKLVSSWGSNIFYMPHGLTIDSESNIWLTDVGLHQVFKYNFRQAHTPLLTLGQAFKKGNDQTHFCKPTSIAVSQLSGDIFVADGYCNSRIAQFTKNGTFVKEIKDFDQPMIVVHSIALIEEKNLVCTVSREEGRIICFDMSTGEKKKEIKNSNMKTVYAIEYDPFSQVIHAVTGSNSYMPSYGLTFSTDSDSFGTLVQRWQPENEDLTDSHDIAVSPDSSKIYIGQLNGEIDEFSFK